LHPARPVHTVWEPRTYPGSLAHLSTVRADLSRDLAGFDGDLVLGPTLGFDHEALHRTVLMDARVLTPPGTVRPRSGPGVRVPVPSTKAGRPECQSSPGVSEASSSPVSSTSSSGGGP